MTPHDPAEVDRRFQELMRAEFADDPGFSPDEPLAGEPQAGRRRLVTERVLPFQAGRVDDDDDDLGFADDESYRDVDDDPDSWSPLSLLGFVLLGGGLAGMFAMLFGFVLGAPWAQIALAATITGLVVLLVQALRSPGPGHDGDGAQV